MAEEAAAVPGTGSRQRKQQRVAGRRREACEHAESKAPTTDTTRQTPPPAPAIPSPAAAAAAVPVPASQSSAHYVPGR